MKGFFQFNKKKTEYRHVQGGNVPGGHNVIYDGRKPFITPMRECNSIPLLFNDRVADIGAYVGTYAIRCARLPVREVVAYEPTPGTFGILSLTRLPNMKLVQAAVVGDDRMEVTLFISSGIGVTNSIASSSRKAGSITVPAIRYEEAVKGATVVKVDVEGAEYGYRIVQPSIRALIIDFHPVPGIDWIHNSRLIIEQIEEAGFRAVIAPDFSNGWTRAGSWIRDVEMPQEEYEPMMFGAICCGCGQAIHSSGRSLCGICWNSWLPRHRIGYNKANDHTLPIINKRIPYE